MGGEGGAEGDPVQLFGAANGVGEHSKVKTAKDTPVHFSKLPRQQPQIPEKSVVDGQAKLRAKQRTEQPSQPREH